jgi:hypothetical protein
MLAVLWVQNSKYVFVARPGGNIHTGPYGDTLATTSNGICLCSWFASHKQDTEHN